MTGTGICVVCLKRPCECPKPNIFAIALWKIKCRLGLLKPNSFETKSAAMHQSMHHLRQALKQDWQEAEKYLSSLDEGHDDERWFFSPYSLWKDMTVVERITALLRRRSHPDKSYMDVVCEVYAEREDVQ